MPHRARQSSLSLTNSKTIFLIGVVVSAFMAFNLVNAIRENGRIQTRIDKLQDDLRTVSTDSEALSHTLDYTATDLFIEEEARNLLNYKKDGEIVVSLPPEKVDVRDQIIEAEVAIAERKNQPNALKWLRFFRDQESPGGTE